MNWGNASKTKCEQQKRNAQQPNWNQKVNFSFVLTRIEKDVRRSEDTCIGSLHIPSCW